MENDSNDEADLLAAIDAFCVTDEGSGSDSDDDGVASVDTSAVALILAGRRSCDAAGFGALAEALSAAATSSCAAASEVVCSEIQVRPRGCMAWTSLTFLSANESREGGRAGGVAVRLQAARQQRRRQH